MMYTPGVATTEIKMKTGLLIATAAAILCFPSIVLGQLLAPPADPDAAQCIDVDPEKCGYLLDRKLLEGNGVPEPTFSDSKGTPGPDLTFGVLSGTPAPTFSNNKGAPGPTFSNESGAPAPTFSESRGTRGPGQ